MTPAELAADYEAAAIAVVDEATTQPQALATLEASHPDHKYVRFLDRRDRDIRTSGRQFTVIAAFPRGHRLYRYLQPKETVEIHDHGKTQPPECFHPQVLIGERWTPDMPPWWALPKPWAIFPDDWDFRDI